MKEEEANNQMCEIKEHSKHKEITIEYLPPPF
jgi:hypothetical protein